jgi:hypothetical protein
MFHLWRIVKMDGASYYNTKTSGITVKMYIFMKKGQGQNTRRRWAGVLPLTLPLSFFCVLIYTYTWQETEESICMQR